MRDASDIAVLCVAEAQSQSVEQPPKVGKRGLEGYDVLAATGQADLSRCNATLWAMPVTYNRCPVLRICKVNRHAERCLL